MLVRERQLTDDACLLYKPHVHLLIEVMTWSDFWLLYTADFSREGLFFFFFKKHIFYMHCFLVYLDKCKKYANSSHPVFDMQFISRTKLKFIHCVTAKQDVLCFLHWEVKYHMFQLVQQLKSRPLSYVCTQFTD